MSDAELDAVTAPYKLVRIRRTAARTGAGGPSDLAWVWIVATAVLGAIVLRRQSMGAPAGLDRQWFPVEKVAGKP